MATKIALAGNPNCGKTTLFNELTGSNQYVGNWPGVTVEKKEGYFDGHKDLVIQDLPGIYSLSPYSLEERVSRNFLVTEKPDCILNIVDGMNIERNLYLTTQLAELGVPMVVAVNMMDLVERQGDKIDFAKLGKRLGCKVVGISAQKGRGCRECAAEAIRYAREGLAGEVPHVFTGSVEHALAHIEESIQGKVPKNAIRWYAIKIFERDQEAIKGLGIPSDVLEHVEEHIKDCERELEDDAESIIVTQRYDFIQKLVKECIVKNEKARSKVRMSDRIDRIVTNRFLAIPIFIVALLAMYWLAVSDAGPGTRLTDWANEEFLGESWSCFGRQLPGVAALCGDLCTRIGVEEGSIAWSLVNDGIVGGVCTVLGFVPVIAIVFLFLAFLEDCGYMARVAFIMDRLFRGFGLSGKSFIPMLVGKGCGVPAVMAARTIENKRDQRMTIILATFIPCGAKTVIIAMFSSLFFRDQWWVAALMDVIGVAIIVLGGIALKKTRFFAGEAAPFVMELPAYHLPTFKGIFIHTWERVKAYVVKAGVIIFPACVVLTLMMKFGWSFQVVENIDDSILASIGGSIAWFFSPLGFGNWQAAAASISAEIAKEQATATLAMVAGGEENIFAFFRSFAGANYREAALGFLLFNLFIPPCLVAIAVTFREMGSKLWGCLALAFQLFVGYTIALNAYQMGILFTTGAWGFWTVVTVLTDLFVLWAIFRPQPKGVK